MFAMLGDTSTPFIKRFAYKDTNKAHSESALSSNHTSDARLLKYLGGIKLRLCNKIVHINQWPTYQRIDLCVV